MSSSITVGGNLHSLRKTSVISSHTSHFLSFVAEGRHNITLWRRECPCSSVIQCRLTVHGQESISSADLDQRHFSAAVDQENWHHTDYCEKWPPFVACLECTKIFVSASSWVQRTSSSRSFVRLLVKIILITMIIYPHCLWETGVS